MQAHVSGQISGQVPNQAGTQFHGLSQQNGNPLQMQMQNLVAQRSRLIMEPDIRQLRTFMQRKINEFLLQRQPQPHGIPPEKILDLVKRLEGGLYKAAATKEEYMNLDTLESRLQILIKQGSLNNHTPQHSQLVNSSPSVGTMIPTPGVQHNVNSNLMVSSSVDTSMISANGCSNISSSAASSGTLLPSASGPFANMHDGLFHSSEGSLSKGYQQTHPNFSLNSSGNNTVATASMSGQRVTSQMIPTPGFGSNNNNVFMNVETASNGGFSSVDSSVAPQQVPQKQLVGGPNSRALQNLGSQIGGGIRSASQQRSFAFNNGSVNGGFGNSLQMMNGSGSSEGYLTTTFGGSPKPLPQHFDHQQQPLVLGDGYGLSSTDSTGGGNVYGPATSIGSIMNTQNLNQIWLQSLPRSNSVISNHSNSPTTQPASHLRPQSGEQLEQPKIQSSQPPQENLSHYHPQQFQLQPHQFQQQQQQFSPHHRQQKYISQQSQVLQKNNAFGPLQFSTDVGSHVKTEPRMECPNEVLQSLVSGQLQLSEFQTKFQQSSSENHPTTTQFSSLLSAPQDICSTMSPGPQQLLRTHQVVEEVQNEFSRLPIGLPAEVLIKAQLHTKPGERASLPGNLLHEQQVQEEFCQRISGHDEAQRMKLPSEGSISGLAMRTITGPPNSGDASCGRENLNPDPQFRNQQKWILFLRHARRCAAPEGRCLEPNCINAQKLLQHMRGCNISPCANPRCHPTKRLLRHHKSCSNQICPVCIPVGNFLQSQLLKVRPWQESDARMPGLLTGHCKPSDAGETNAREISKSSRKLETAIDSQPILKRLKTELPTDSVMPEGGSLFVPFHAISDSRVPMDVQLPESQNSDSAMQMKPEVNMETHGSSTSSVTEMKNDVTDAPCNQKPDGGSLILNDSDSQSKQEIVKLDKVIGETKQEDVAQHPEYGVGTKSGKPKIKGVSLTELFTPEQIREHITGLRQWVGQSKAKAEKNQAMEHTMSENSCQLCAVERLTFEPPPIYCTPCGARIKRNATYYTVGTGDTRHYFCIPCHNEARGDTIVVDGAVILKSKLEKKKNDEETEEWWVQCDKCEAWQHQICALFNGRRNDGGQAEYTCPNCYIQEIEMGERQPLPQSAVLGAKDLPRTILSDHIEQRLFSRLKEERQQRAKLQGKVYDEVPGAEGIVIRVVSSVDKKLEVKPRFLEIFREENYPVEFPYKSKVILLFQKIEGVEVCLFGMYVQEFGSECQPPNQRRVYLSYLDSVKYFCPEVKAVTGEALRTFVYHEILIGYLDYCKKRGFTSCYIWACPPLKGEDYILYCHPEIQKTPKSDKLREWYLSMLKKAARENIVVELTNLYDHFFTCTGECKAKVTAARLPYFDGDYWPGAAEDLIYQINQDEEERKQNKKAITKKATTKRAMKASGHPDLSGNTSKDLHLMRKLGDTIFPMKEDFIMVHLQYSCTHCCVLMVSGNRWVCNQCKNFQICDGCYEAEQKLDERERHPINQKDKHVLYPIEITDVLEDTKDKDEILESEFFDTRQAFLSLCQGNHYQYDTLRRAKHSSMMVLYHLHNPTAPAFVTPCIICHLDIETGQGWRCETCPDYDVCNACYQKEGGIDHPHKLTNHPSIADRDAQNKEARQLRVLQLRKMLDLLVHASQCRSPHCQYPNCRKVKGLFRHGIQCKTRAPGGCVLCKKMWYLLQLHSRACKESECHVPRCRDLKEHLRRLQQQSDSRRRAAVMEMMRQRAAEVAGNGG
ncbi:hypothetical protein Nepgr_019379 [Nepenthes gracilis]|uniref:histone acetyltransferase n=1 Tax=Nepenthes gracilis TaxID=150966 RepID=A0AAD3STB3_NEPGR|nr:hypothetical protein Nepgr_019379 [Nepenthes gracilis]